MSWWLGPSIIGVIAAGIVAGLLISYLILRMKNHDFFLTRKNKRQVFNVMTKSAGTLPVEQRSVDTQETKTNPVISVDDKVESYLYHLNIPSVEDIPDHKISEALIELENNLTIASKPMNNHLSNFQIDVWNTKRSEFNLLDSELRGEVTEAYVDMLLANNIVWLVTELGRNSQDLITSYYKLSNKVAERLQRIMPAIRDSFN